MNTTSYISHHYPRPYVYGQDGNLKRQGELGVVIFKNGNSSCPIWLGAIRPGNWYQNDIFHGYTKSDSVRKAERWETETSLIERVDDGDGDRSEQVITNAPLDPENDGSYLNYENRRKKLTRVVTKASTNPSQEGALTGPGTRQVVLDGLKEGRQEGGAKLADGLPAGEYYAVRNYEPTDGKATSHVGVTISDTGEVTVDIDSLLEGVVQAVKNKLGKANLNVNVKGQQPQEENGAGIPAHGNVNLQYNGNFSLLNHQTVVQQGENDTTVSRDVITQEIAVDNSQNREQIKLEQQGITTDTSDDNFNRGTELNKLEMNAGSDMNISLTNNKTREEQTSTNTIYMSTTSHSIDMV